ncbi:hypothetical protein SAMN05421821_107169 [Mucilaginibacter lappiensis]|uniref:Uncharacterized protein n=1 Tax=Mucilaginibacter lappiensis TaxID=354630 RepID=A0ABR6PM16_9SPHI|nr:hypothetical protein [Mucilaginibacter lappiensis]MBB6110646.1 hypothetical protein [Mucilaginibacter lappiensis]SIR44222.1 hypothetical protein SAMN05421821_107169 [Mucilaginibacter lappiensis]
MLQNRVDPRGNIVKTSARGAWLGNRGQLHGDTKTILRPFKLKAWLTCVLKFKGRHRQVMAPNLYTELFFFDEATAFSAGHRPCFECRRDDANRFKTAWLKGNPEYGFDPKVHIEKIDEIIHQERIDKKGNKVTFEAAVHDLPDGVFIQIDNEPYLLANKMIWHWTPSGYEQMAPLPVSVKVIVLTPRSVVKAFRSGYRPQMGTDDLK